MTTPAEHWFEVGTRDGDAALCVAVAAMPEDRKRAADLFAWAAALGHPIATELQAQVMAQSAVEGSGTTGGPPNAAKEPRI